jgi:hypothetical protein
MCNIRLISDINKYKYHFYFQTHKKPSLFEDGGKQSRLGVICWIGLHNVMLNSE